MANAVVPLSNASARAHRATAPVVLHLAVSRSAAVRLAPLAEAGRSPQAWLGPDGRMRHLPEPTAPCGPTLASPRDVARVVTSALERLDPDVVLVAGDNDAALAATLSATRAGVPVARVGAGLRSGDRTAPREVNRIAIDGLAARLYVDGPAAADRLQAEGVRAGQIVAVGSMSAAVVHRQRDAARERAAWAQRGLGRGRYVLVSLHRSESFVRLAELVGALAALAREVAVVLCVDDAVGETLMRGGAAPRPVIAGALDHLEFLSLLTGAAAVVTDSSGVQEESTVLGVPCFTLGAWSERELTLTHGTNVLLGDDPRSIAAVPIASARLAPATIALWDAEVGRRIADDVRRAPWGGA